MSNNNEVLPSARDFTLRENVEWCFLAIAALLRLESVSDELLANFNYIDAIEQIRSENKEIGDALDNYYRAYQTWYELDPSKYKTEENVRLTNERDKRISELKELYFKILKYD